ncbi:MAG: hypothetical protein HYV96_11155 [Opitutae bacterium]|nr:hypothetical protein [Opitutae bacterium]
MKLTSRLRTFLSFAFLALASALFAAPAARAAKPTIYAFNQSGSGTINLGESVSLNWSVSHGASVSLSPGIGAVSGTEIVVTPTQTTTYTLTATNASGSVSKSRKITVVMPPTIASLTATPGTVLPAGASTLAWTGTGANYYTVTTDAGANLGNVFGTRLKVYPQTTTNYTVTAVNTAGTGSRSIVVTVVPPGPKPGIASFTATPATIVAGQSTALEWSASNANSLSISPGIGAVTGNRVSVSPAATTTYTLTAKNLNGTTTKKTTVTVTVAPPSIASFTAMPDAIVAGQSSTLAWSVSGADALSISPDVGAVTGTSVSVSPAASTTYTLSATNAGGTVTKTVSLAVAPPTPPPAIAAFTASSASIVQGDSLTLNWSVTGADTLSLSPLIGAVSGTSVAVAPGVGTTYVLTASNAAGTVTASVSVAVTAPVPPPAIHAFTATPDTLAGTGNATLTWSVDGATELTILADAGANPGNVLGLPSFTVSPGATTIYTLYAKNATATVTQDVTVTVADPTPTASIDTFVASSDNVTAGEPVTLSWTTTNLGSLWLSADAGGDPGAVSGMSSIVVHPQTTTRYVLSGWAGPAGTIWKALVVNVGPPPAPVVNSFAASPDSIAVGASTTLDWSVANADSVSIAADVGASPGVVTGNSVVVSPAATTTYTLTAALGSASATRTATVTVTGPTAPNVAAFYAQPAFIQSGASTTLTWNVSGADTLSISPGIGAVTGNSVAVTPTASTTYTLTAQNQIGATTRTASVTIYTPGSGSVQHPRLWLTPPSLAALQQRAAANDPAWLRLRADCDAYAALPVAFPDAGNSSGTISGGYQYYDYMRPSFELALGYLVARTVDPVRAARYAAKERELLLALSDPVHHGFSLIDSGWAIRAYVPALAIGYDWIFETLSDSDRAQIYTEINRWVADYEAGGFGRSFPQGNYFAGYYAAKALGALATEGENPAAPAMWDDWLNRVHYGLVQPYHQQWLSGGAAPDGWNYGAFETINMVRPLAAAFTAKGLDLIHDAAHPHAYPDGNVKWVAQFTWPDLNTVSDRGLIYDGDNPTGTDAGWATQYTGFLRLANGDNAPIAQRYTFDLRSAQGTSGIEPWADFLLFDAVAPTAAYRTAVSYATAGAGEVAMRSSWASDAVWASFQAGPYTGYDQSAEEHFDQGGLAIQRGGVQFLVNTWGALLRNTPGTGDGGGSVFTRLYTELYDQGADGVNGARRIFNTFYAARPGGYWGQIGNGPDGANTTTLSRFEEGTDYVLARGTKLESQYFSDHPIQAWARTVVFLRPQLFVVHDRTTVSSAIVDNWMAWHVAAAPSAQAAAPGTHRFDVVDTRAAFGGNLFRGRVTTVLPAGHTVTDVDVFGLGKVHRLEVRPGTPAADNTWLAVLDASASAAQAGNVAALTNAAGNLSTNAAEGALIRNAAGNYAVLFSKTASAIAGSFTVKVPADDTYLLIADLVPSAGYSVTATLANGELTLAIASGGNATTTPQGTLKIDITAAGVVTPL